MFFYLDAAGKQAGPVAKSELISCGVNAETLVWKAGMEQWQKAKEVSELQSLFAKPAPATAPVSEPTPAQINQPYTSQAEVENQPISIAEEDRPHNYLPLAIIATVLFCPPFGIPAIVSAAKVDSLYNSGNYEEAKEAANKARGWGKAGIITGVIFWTIYTVAYTILAFSA